MNRTTSTYLDLVRFNAALLVFFYHAKHDRFDGAWLKEIGAFGHDAVMIFFVISGFVIAYVTANKEKTIQTYVKSRLVRLYSVIIPALFLTIVLDHVGKQLNPDIYIGVHYEYSEPVVRFLTNMFFINELWFNSWIAFSNSPFWSLCYEFWYYVIFASMFYFRGVKKYFLTIVAMSIAGPKILLLLPIWGMGVYIYHASKKFTLTTFQALSFTILPIIIYFLYRDMNGHKYLWEMSVNLLGREFLFEELKWSRRFLNDYIVGILFSIHLIGMISLSKYFTFSIYLERPIRYLAGMTFAVYLFHFPLLQFFGSFVETNYTIVFLVFGCIVLLAPITEGKKRNLHRLIDSYLIDNRKIRNA